MFIIFVHNVVNGSPYLFRKAYLKIQSTLEDVSVHGACTSMFNAEEEAKEKVSGFFSG